MLFCWCLCFFIWVLVSVVCVKLWYVVYVVFVVIGVGFVLEEVDVEVVDEWIWGYEFEVFGFKLVVFFLEGVYC